MFSPLTTHEKVIELYCEWFRELYVFLKLSEVSNSAPPVVLGHSFGGYIITQCAGRHPSLASRLLLSDVPGAG